MDLKELVRSLPGVITGYNSDGPVGVDGLNAWDLEISEENWNESGNEVRLTIAHEDDEDQEDDHYLIGWVGPIDFGDDVGVRNMVLVDGTMMQASVTAVVGWMVMGGGS